MPKRAPTTARPNEKRLDHREVPAFLRKLRASDEADVVKDALEWLILTATRTIETLGVPFGEVDEKRWTWTIARERVPSAEHHVVPLSPRAREIYAARKPPRAAKAALIFEGAPGKSLSSAALLMAMRRQGSAAVPHGFCYSFSAWAKAHAPDVTDRRQLLEAWSTFCATAKTAKPKRAS